MSKFRFFLWFMNLVWPWFVKNVWPIIEKQIVDIFGKAAGTAKDSAYDWLDRRKKAREEAAQKRAAEAEEMARNAPTDAEAEKHRAIAQVWHEVAEQFRRENEELKEKLDDIQKKSASDFRDEMKSMDVMGIIQEADVLGLPEPNDTSTQSFSHVITAEVEFYTTEPQKGRSPDGKFLAGTKVNIIQQAGSYTLVRSEGGVEAYVASDAIKETEP